MIYWCGLTIYISERLFAFQKTYGQLATWLNFGNQLPKNTNLPMKLPINVCKQATCHSLPMFFFFLFAKGISFLLNSSAYHTKSLNGSLCKSLISRTFRDNFWFQPRKWLFIFIWHAGCNGWVLSHT